MKILNDSPIFIVGMPRSGTTLLSNLLNATNEIYIPEETHIFQLLEKYEKLGLGISFKEFFLDPKSNPYLDQLNLRDNQKTIIKNSDINTAAGILEKICIIKSEDKGISRWGEKTPIHFKYTDDIFTHFNNALVVNVVRDPRDVMISIKNIGWKRHFLYKRIKEYSEQATLIQNNKDNSKMIVIKYEDILEEPEKYLKKIFNFLNLKFNLNILENFYKPNNLNFDLNKEPWKKNNLKPIDKTQAYKWKNSPNSFLIKTVSGILKDEINYYGYEKGKHFSGLGYIFIRNFLYFKNLSIVLLKSLMRILFN